MGEEQLGEIMTNSLVGKVLKVAMGEVLTILCLKAQKQNYYNRIMLMSPNSCHVHP